MPSARRSQVAKTSKSFHEVLLENVKGLVFVKDEKFNLVYANKAFLELYPPQERASVVGRASAENFSEEEAKVFNSEDQKALDYGFSEIVEEISNYKGQKFMFQTQKIRFIDEQGNVRILGIATDVTRLVEHEKMLAKSNVALENFAAVAAHDLRSPLAALSVSLDLIKGDHATQLGARAARHIELMSTCLEGLIEQVAELLATYKVGNDDNAPYVDCDLSVLFEEVKFNLSNNIKWEKAKVLSTELPTVRVNKSLYRQLIHNLIENSLKYHGPSVPIIIMRHHETDNEHIFSIEDNGIGIAPEQRNQIFMYRAQLGNKKEGCGIGLGLCREIVEKHGGKIWLDETFTTGCRICFSLPKFLKIVS
jgi:PAS domain S-box-containing protein